MIVTRVLIPRPKWNWQGKQALEIEIMEKKQGVVVLQKSASILIADSLISVSLDAKKQIPRFVATILQTFLIKYAFAPEFRFVSL